MSTPHRSSILRVDVRDGSVRSEPLPGRWRRRFLGGKGIGARLLWEELDAGIDPLGPANRLAILLGPVSGYLPGEARIAAVTKSPLTGLFLDSYMGGPFAEALCGALERHVGLVIEGVAPTPVRVDVEDDDAVVEPASDLWGHDSAELAASVDGEAAGPGPAGEAQVAFATIASDGGAHQAGRGGAGAVLGAKRVKAIVARGRLEASPRLDAIRAAYEARLERIPEGRWQRSGGTLETVDAADALGVLPTEGWRRGRFAGAEAVGIDAVRARATDREGDDRAVPGDYRIDDLAPRGALAISLGANLGLDDFDAVLALGRTCDRLGLDLIDGGNAAAWAIHAANAGLIDRDLAFGDPDGIAALFGEIAARSTRLGDRLADGIDAAASAYGGVDLVPTVKSMSAATYDPRRTPSMALSYATSDRGACHRRARPIFDELLADDAWSDQDRAEAVVAEQDYRSLLWCMIADDLTAPAFEADLGGAFLEAVGVDLDRAELEAVGQRVWTMTRLFNVREGVRREDDALPAAFSRPLESDDDASVAIDPATFEALLDRYYAERGWDQSGVPTQALLERLGLDDAIDETAALLD